MPGTDRSGDVCHLRIDCEWSSCIAQIEFGMLVCKDKHLDGIPRYFGPVITTPKQVGSTSSQGDVEDAADQYSP